MGKINRNLQGGQTVTLTSPTAGTPGSPPPAQGDVIAGVDSGGTVRFVRVDSNGKLVLAANANATYVQNDTLTTAQTETAPANAVGFILLADDGNGDSIRFTLGTGSPATASHGFKLLPGRDTGFVPCSQNISICSQSGTNAYQLQWVQQ